MKDLKFKRLSQTEITEEEFKQVCEVENSTGSGYPDVLMRKFWVESGTNDNFVCLDGDRIVGHITFNPNSRRRNGSIYMVNLTVLPEYRKMGVAQGLIEEATNFYIDNGAELPMSLNVDVTNKPALKLYKKVGYEIAEVVCEWDDCDDQYIMEASLEKIKTTIDGLKNQFISE